MKKIWHSIVLFFEKIFYIDIVAEEIINLLTNERDSWTQVEEHSYEGATVLRFEKEGSHYGTLVIFEMFTSTIKVGDKDHVFWLDTSNHLHRAAFPEMHKFIPEKRFHQADNIFSI